MKNILSFVKFTIWVPVLRLVKHSLESLLVALCGGKFSSDVGNAEMRLARSNNLLIGATLTPP